MGLKFTVSVIIPAFNEEKYLDACLASLVRQTLQPDEVLVGNNCSTDKTRQVALNYRNKLPLKVIDQPAKGIYPTVEMLWRQSRGDIIIRTDADNILPKYWLNNIINHFKTDPNLVACGGNYYLYDGNFVYKLLNPFFLALSDIYYLVFKGYRFLFGANFAVRRHTMEAIDGYKSAAQLLNDDSLICQKLKDRGYKFTRFDDCWNFTSARRFINNPKEIISVFLFTFKGRKYYHEKST